MRIYFYLGDEWVKSMSIVEEKYIAPGVSKQYINPIPRIGEKVIVNSTKCYVSDVVHDIDEIRVELIKM